MELELKPLRRKIAWPSRINPPQVNMRVMTKVLKKTKILGGRVSRMDGPLKRP